MTNLTERDPEGDNLAIVAPTETTFEITDTKLFVPVVILSKENDIKLLDQLKLEFKRTIKWNKNRSQMTIQPENNNLNYLIDPTCTSVNRLFVLLFTRNNTGNSRDSFSHYYVPNIEIKVFNVLIEGKSFFNLPLKIKKKPTRKVLKWVTIMITQLVIY